jgi:hypothetical protein
MCFSSVIAARTSTSASAGMAHYRTAGAMLLEAKEQVQHGLFERFRLIVVG